MLFDEFLPTYDVSDSVAIVVNADVASTWEALMDVDLIDVGRQRPLFSVLGAIRALPDLLNQLLHARILTPPRLRLRDLTRVPLGQGGWVLLGQRDQDEIALGLVGQFWKPVIEFPSVKSADEFRDFSRPGVAKTVYSLSVQRLEGERRSSLASCAPRRPTHTHVAGSAVIGRSGSGQARTYWSTAS